jgi:sulfate permease, SulP family
VLRRHIPILEWLPRYRRTDLVPDLLAGLSVGAVLVPQSMAYAQIAGLPPITGLYASTVPLVVYGALGRTRRLGIGPLVTTSIIAATGLRHVAHEGSSKYVAYAATLAVLVGVIHLVLGVFRLGFLARFISEPVIAGFLAGMAAIAISGQLAPLTGVAVPNEERPYIALWDWLTRVDEVELLSTVLGIGAFAALVLGKRVPRFPVPLAAIVVPIIAVDLFDWHGDVALVGQLPSGLPGFDVPPFGSTEVRLLIGAAFAITMVGFLESFGLAKREAAVSDTEADANQELIALGSANVATGFFQGMPVTGALTRTTVAEVAGARTQVNSFVSVLVVVAALVVLTGPFEDVPQPVLAGIVVAALVHLLDVRRVQRLWRVKRADAAIMVATAVLTYVVGIEAGVIIAVVASLVVVLYRVSEPRVAAVDTLPDAVIPAGVLFVQVDGPLFFGNAEYVTEHVATLEREAAARGDPPRVLVIGASGIDDLDATAVEVLRELAADHARRGMTVLFVAVKPQVWAVMDAAGFSEVVGAGAFYPTNVTVLRAARAITGQ